MRYSTLTYAAAFAILLFIAGCTPTKDESPCGPEVTWKAHKTTLAIVNTQFDYTDSTITVYFEDLSEPDDICAMEHCTADFFLFADDTTFSIEWTARAYWGAQPLTKPMGTTNAGNKFAGAVMEIGLKQVFDDQPAFVGLQFLAKFKTQGNDSLDRIKAYEAIGIGDITLKYKRHK